MTKKQQKILELIPLYPGGCSKELLALSMGYIKAPYNLKKIEKAVKSLDKDLAWLTLKEGTIVERVLPLQRSTINQVKEISSLELTQKSATYISRNLRVKKQ